jgi:DNA-binding response OmpR family regulator
MSVIALLTANEVQARFIEEMLEPLGHQLETYSVTAPPTTPPSLAVIWWQEGQNPAKNGADTLMQLAGRTIILADDPAAAQAARAWGPDAVFMAPYRAGLIIDRARTFLNPAVQARLPALMVCGPYDFYPRENRVHHKKNKSELRLTDKERDILLTLLGAQGQPVSRQELLDSVWAYAPGVETHTLETHIYRLRQKIEADPSGPQILLTDDAGYKILTT